MTIATKNGGSGKPSFLGYFFRIIVLIGSAFGVALMVSMHSATLKTLLDHKDEPISPEDFADSPRQLIAKQTTKIEELSTKNSNQETKIEVLIAKNSKQEGTIAELTTKVEAMAQLLEHEKASLKGSLKELERDFESTRKKAEELIEETNRKFPPVMTKVQGVEASVNAVVKQISNLRAGGDGTSGDILKVHFWDDSTHQAPREDILVDEGWLQYNGKALGDPDDLQTKPWFVKTDDPWEADLIIWVSVMARHELEVPPIDPVQHAHKVIVLDFSDGCTIHSKKGKMQDAETIIAYFKRSFVRRNGNAMYNGNCTSSKDVYPYSYNGAKAMLMPYSLEESNVNFEADLRIKFGKTGEVYGKLAKHQEKPNDHANNGYFQDPRYENFLVPFQDRKWSVSTMLRDNDGLGNVVRRKIVWYTKEFCKEKAGEPRKNQDVIDNPDPETSDFTCYIGEIDPKCNGYCFGANYLRHIRDAKIIITSNPYGWEGDFRLWESFLSGAMVMVDTMAIPDMMPNPPIDKKHWVVYDQSNPEDVKAKLAYYTDPANLHETEAIAKAGYEHVLRHHMSVNRVEFLLNQEKIRSNLQQYITNPKKRAILGLDNAEAGNFQAE